MSDNEQYRRPLRRPLNLNGTGVGAAAFSLPMPKAVFETDLSRRAREDPVRTRREVQAALDSVERAARLSAQPVSFLGTDPVSRLLRQREDPFLRPAFPQNPAFVTGREDAGRGPAVGRKRPLSPAPNVGRGVRSLRSYEPSLRDRAAWEVYDIVGRLGSPNLGRLYAGRARQLVDFVPVLGDAVGFEEAGRDLYQGRYVEGTIGGVATAIGVIPAIGDAAAKVILAGRRSIADRLGALIKRIDDSPSNSRPLDPGSMSSGSDPGMAEPSEVELYGLPGVPEQDVRVQYGRDPETDAAGNLTRDVDGRPMSGNPRFTVGRTRIDGASRPLHVDDYFDLAEGLSELPPDVVPPNDWRLQHRLGVKIPSSQGDMARQVLLDSTLDQSSLEDAMAHEVGHVINRTTGDIDIAGLEDELPVLYHVTNTGRFPSKEEKLFTPDDRRYPSDKHKSEVIAEALRAYLGNPQAMNLFFPKTAARLRKAVNTNPRLENWLRLNASAAISGAGLAAWMVHQDSRHRVENQITE